MHPSRSSRSWVELVGFGSGRPRALGGPSAHAVTDRGRRRARRCSVWLASLVLLVALSGCHGESSEAHPSAGPKAHPPEAAGGSDASAASEADPEVSPGAVDANPCTNCSPIDSTTSPPSTQDCDAGTGCVVEDAGPVVVSPSVTCLLDADPRDQPACVDDEYGLFVDSRGDDANPGTKAAPLKTIGAALTKARGRLHIFVCRGIYPESVVLTDALSLHGGFECDSWKYSGGLGVAVMPAAAGQYAVHLDGVRGAHVTDLSFIAAQGTAQARSSVAAFVARSSGVVLRRVLLQGQRGGNGASGARGAPGQHDRNPEGLSSNSTTDGAPERICTCSSGGITIGGAGGGGEGMGNNDGGNGGPATAIFVPPEAQGAGQTALRCARGDSLHIQGSAGTPGSDGLPAGVVGYVDAEHGFVPADGAAGGPGLPGQGGGGGGGKSGNDPGGGGAGGCGGCAATGTTGGQGGGASLALLALEAEVRLEQATVTTAEAGDGGQGLDGARGGVGAGGGSGFGQGCTGGRGGDGGNGGASAGGAGGSSIGVAFRGTAPELDASTRAGIKVGAAGVRGMGGAPGFNDGVPGISAAVSAL